MRHDDTYGDNKRTRNDALEQGRYALVFDNVLETIDDALVHGFTWFASHLKTRFDH